MRITQPIMHSVLEEGRMDETCLDTQSFALLKEIQRELSVFEPINDDETRMIWLEIPRGTAEEILEWDNRNHECPEDEESELQSYRDMLAEYYPREIEWFLLTTSTYKENSFLSISDRCRSAVTMSNRDSERKGYGKDMTWFLGPLLDLVKSRAAEIARSPETYNRHVESFLPYHQRMGRIRSRDLNAILPDSRLDVENREYCIAVMRDLIRRKRLYEEAPADADSQYWKKNNLPEPSGEMTIRKFCHYFRIADSTHWDSYESSERRHRDPVDDVEYYENSSLHYGKLDGLNLDSVDDFKSFAHDHYGEIGLSRMNVGGSDHYVKGRWLITFGISYSAYIDSGLKVALALYESGAAFIYHDAENTLHVLEETGWVRIEPRTFHDYLGNGDDEGVISVPFEDECRYEGEMSVDQLRQIIKKAVWQKQVKVRMDRIIPYDDHAYDLVRDNLLAPTTLSEIRRAVEDKYGTYLSVFKSYKGNGFSYTKPRVDEEGFHSEESKAIYPTFNEAMYALILEFNEVKYRQQREFNT